MIEKDRARASGLGFTDDGQTRESEAVFERARAVLAGGVSSSGRAVTAGPLDYPICMSRARGSRIYDADENEFIDYLLGYGSVILGHGPKGLAEEVARTVGQGTTLAAVNQLEVDLAGMIKEMVPHAGLVRFANSGTEAVCAAIRVARGARGVDKIVKFEGHYHGWADVLAVSVRPDAAECGPIESPARRLHSRGIPEAIANDVIICPWNNADILRRILSRHSHEIAAVIAEPIVANNACIVPAAGFLEVLRSECDRHRIVLIFDEVSTGFRVAPGGAAALYGVFPDLVVFSKAVGNGFPISVLAGHEGLMGLVATNEVRHGGTYNGNTLCAAAGLYTLTELSKPEVQDRLRATGAQVMEALRRSAIDHRVPCIVQGVEQMFQVVFGISDPPRHYREVLKGDFTRFDRFRFALLRRGIQVTHSPLAAWFISAAHTDEDVDLTISAIDEAMKDVA